MPSLQALVFRADLLLRYSATFLAGFQLLATLAYSPQSDTPLPAGSQPFTFLLFLHSLRIFAAVFRIVIGTSATLDCPIVSRVGSTLAQRQRRARLARTGLSSLPEWHCEQRIYKRREGHLSRRARYPRVDIEAERPAVAENTRNEIRHARIGWRPAGSAKTEGGTKRGPAAKTTKRLRRTDFCACHV